MPQSIVLQSIGRPVWLVTMGYLCMVLNAIPGYLVRQVPGGRRASASRLQASLQATCTGLPLDPSSAARPHPAALTPRLSSLPQ